MALLPVHSFFSLNGVLLPKSEFVASENDGGIYEVVRVEQGIPLFWEEHMGRFYRSAEIARKTICFKPLEIAQFIADLIDKNEVYTGNILISYRKNLKAFFIPHNYPSAEQYSRGVDCGILYAERNNPNAKVFQTEVRTKANQIISEQKVYEVVLVDRENKVTEGSRSNLFFIRGEEIFTPRASNVLLGITREKALKCAQEIDVKVEEKDILLAGLSDFDAAFISGTSPKILPVKNIGASSFKTDNPVLRKLMQQYDLMIDNYIAQKKGNHPFHK